MALLSEHLDQTLSLPSSCSLHPSCLHMDIGALRLQPHSGCEYGLTFRHPTHTWRDTLGTILRLSVYPVIGLDPSLFLCFLP